MINLLLVWKLQEAESLRKKALAGQAAAMLGILCTLLPP